MLRDVNISVQRGEVVGLLGPNGAGKTTCFYIVTGLIAPDFGSVFLDQQDITALPMYRRARLGIGYLPQEASIFRGLTVEENLRAVLEVVEPSRPRARPRSMNSWPNSPSRICAARHRWRCRGENAAVSRLRGRLRPIRNSSCWTSRWRASIRLRFHDIRDLVAHLKDRGIGVVITDHNVRETLRTVDRAYILHEGRVLKEGKPSDIVSDADVRRFYLGERFSFLASPALTLYFAPGSSAMAPHIALHEIGARFEGRPVSFAKKEQLQPAFLAFNPEGKVPTLLIDGRPLTEVAAILFYLAKTFLKAGLLPEALKRRRRPYRGCLSLRRRCNATRRLGGEAGRAAFALADKKLGKREWALGDYSIADIHLFRLYWRLRPLLKVAPDAMPALEAHYARMMNRPAVKRTIEIESAIGYELP